MPLQARDWTHLNICNGIIGLKRLIMIYGPVKVTEQHFGKNENGEIKVWISVNP